MAVADPENLVVTGLTSPTDYTVTISPTRNELTINLVPGSANVKALAGDALVITYDMVLTEDAVPDTIIENNASIIINGTTTTEMTPPPGVVTGGKQFIKKDGQTDKALENAKFKAYRETEEGMKWATFTVNALGVNAFAGWVTDEADATEVTSAADGVIKITGLRQGTYFLKETVTPDGYVLLDEPQKFTVVYGGYGETAQLRQPILNVPKGLLPATGGTGIYAFLAIGSMMMLGAYIWFKRSKEQAEV